MYKKREEKQILSVLFGRRKKMTGLLGLNLINISGNQGYMHNAGYLVVYKNLKHIAYRHYLSQT